ncbi:MAG: hypothetical protein HRF49_11630 [bacterium]|jgi:DNA-binding beta-propeller fold protein YncE
MLKRHSVLYLLFSVALLSCGGSGGQKTADIRIKPPVDTTGEITISTADGAAKVSFASDLFATETELRLSNILSGLANSGFPEGRIAVAAIEFKKIGKDPPADTGGDNAGSGEGGDGGETGGGDDGGLTKFEDEIGGSVNIEMSISAQPKWPGGAQVTLYKWSDDLAEWRDSAVKAEIGAEDGKARAAITRFGRYAVFSPLPEELPPPSAGTPKTLAATKLAVKLVWDRPAYQLLAGYNVYRSAEADSGFNKLNLEPLTEEKYIDLTAGTGTIYYRLSLVSTAGLEGEKGPALMVAIPGTDFYGKFGFSGGGSAELKQPGDVLFVPTAGTIVVTDAALSRLVLYDESGKFVREVRSPPSASTRITEPVGLGITADGSKIYVTDRALNRVFILSSNFEILGSFGGGGTGAGFLDSPSDCAIRADGVVFVSDSGNDRIQYFTPSGTYLGEFGASGSGNGQFDDPGYLIFDSTGKLYVGDRGNSRIAVISDKLEFDSAFDFSDAEQPAVPPLEIPAGLALDSRGNLFVADAGRSRVLAADSAGKFVFLFGSYGKENGKFGAASPQGLSFDPTTGLLYASDPANGRIQVFQP